MADRPVQPSSREEYDARVTANTRITGFGAEVVTHMPCPFCGAPDFAELPILDPRTPMEEGRTCSDCGRSSKAIFHDAPGMVRFEFVQTGGPDPDEWVPTMRRVE